MHERTFANGKIGASATVQCKDLADIIGQEVLDKLPEQDRNAAIYLWDYGIKQCLMDSYASAKDAAEFDGKLRKRNDAVWAGRLKPAGGVARTFRSPLDKGIFDIASGIVAAAAKAGGHKLGKEVFEGFVAEYSASHLEELTAQAQVALDAQTALATAAADDMAILFAGLAPKAE